MCESFILTKRRNLVSAKKQISSLGINGKVVCIEDRSKFSWIKENISSSVDIIIVGDSTEELEVAQLNNVSAYMVGYGLMTKADFDKRELPYLYFDKPEMLRMALNNVLNQLK